MSGNRLFSLEVKTLGFYPVKPDSNRRGYFFQLCFNPLLRLLCHKMEAGPGSDFCFAENGFVSL